MKKLLLLLVTSSVVLSISAQPMRAKAPSATVQMPAGRTITIDQITNLQTEVNPYVSREIDPPTETEIGGTVFDLQSNASTPSNRIEAFSDGTIGAVWTRGVTTEGSYPDRGTGYNYFNGAAWGPNPTARVESVRTGWPSYTACGPTGEAFVVHTGTGPLTVYKRETKGTGNWTSLTVPIPAGVPDMLWPRMTSSGPDNNYLHLFGCIPDVANGGQIYQGLDGAVVYSRSTDAGATWSAFEILPDMTPENYIGFSADDYNLTAVGNNVVLLYCSKWTDLLAMVSNDNGETWERTVIWEHPVPLFNWDTPYPDTTYSPDGSAHATFDHDGKLHVAFGTTRILYETGTTYTWYPGVNGLAYWNSDMPTFGNDPDALDTETLDLSGNLVGWAPDVNGDGTYNWVCTTGDCIGVYDGQSPASFPQLIVDAVNDVYVVFSATTEGYNTGVQDFKHLWMSHSLDGGTTWEFMTHLSDDIIHLYDECVFPSIAREAGAYQSEVRLIYQVDNEPGLSVRGDEDAPTDNIFYYMEITKPTVGAGNEPISVKEIQLSTYPNPFTNNTTIDVTTGSKSNVVVEVYSVTGQKVMEHNYGQYPAGMFKINLDASALESGLYFVKVKAGEQSSTTKIQVL